MTFISGVIKPDAGSRSALQSRFLVSSWSNLVMFNILMAFSHLGQLKRSRDVREHDSVCMCVL